MLSFFFIFSDHQKLLLVSFLRIIKKINKFILYDNLNKYNKIYTVKYLQIDTHYLLLLKSLLIKT